MRNLLLLSLVVSLFLYSFTTCAQNALDPVKNSLVLQISFPDSLKSTRFVLLTFIGLQNRQQIVIQNVRTDENGKINLFFDGRVTSFFLRSDSLKSHSDTLLIDRIGKTLHMVVLKDRSIQLNSVSIRAPDVLEKAFKREYLIKGLSTNKAPVLKSFLEEIPEISVENGVFMAYGGKKIVYFLNGVRSTENVVFKLPLALIKKLEVISDPNMLRSNDINTVSVNVITKKSSEGQLGASSSVSGAILNPLAGISFDPYFSKKDLLMTLSFNTYYNKNRNTSLSTWRTKTFTNLVDQVEQADGEGIGNPLFLSFFVQKNMSKNVVLSTSLDYNRSYQNINRILSISKSFRDEPTILQREHIDVIRRGNEFNAATELFFQGKKDKSYLNLAYLASGIDNHTLDSVYTDARFLKNIRNELTSRSSDLAAQFSTEHSYSEKLTQRFAVLYNQRQMSSKSLLSQASVSNPVNEDLQDSRYTEKTLSFTGALTINPDFANIVLAGRIDLSGSYNGGVRYFRAAQYSPQLYIYKSLKKAGNFNLSAYRTVSVPNQIQVSSGNILFSQNNLVLGNPQLSRESTYKVDLTHDLTILPKTSKIALRSSLSYLNTKGLISNTGYSYDQDNQIFFSQIGNIGQIETLGMYSGMTKRIKKIGYYKFSGSLKFNKYAFTDSIQSNRIVYGFNSTLSLNVVKKLTTTLNFYYNNVAMSPYTISKMRPSASLTASGQLVKNKLYFEADWSNILNWNGTSNSLYQSYAVKRATHRNQFSQNISFSMTWILGKKLTKDNSANQVVDKQEVKMENLLNKF